MQTDRLRRPRDLSYSLSVNDQGAYLPLVVVNFTSYFTSRFYGFKNMVAANKRLKKSKAIFVHNITSFTLLPYYIPNVRYTFLLVKCYHMIVFDWFSIFVHHYY